MTTLRTAAQQALAFTMRDFASLRDFEAAKAVLYDNLRAALAQKDEPVWMHPWPPVRAQQAEPVQKPVAWYQKRGQEVLTSHPACWGREDEPWTPLYTAPPHRQPETIDDAMQQPRAMAQAYEAGYKAGVAAEREACAKLCEAEDPHGAYDHREVAGVEVLPYAPTYTEQQIADACMAAEVPDSKCESVLLALRA